MKTIHLTCLGCSTLALLLFTIGDSCFASVIQPVSVLATNQSPPSGGNGDSALPILSSDGRFVLFASTANNLVLTSNNIPIPALLPARFNVYLRDRTNATTTLVSVSTNGLAGANEHSLPAGLSTDGQFALFESEASNLVPGDTNSGSDVFLRDVINGVTCLVSASTNGIPGNAASHSAAMTPDGRYVAFVSEANNLTPGDSNRIADVFLRDLQNLSTAVVSVGARSTNPTALTPGGSSESPQLTPDARFIAFTSTVTNLVPGVRTVGDVYVHDRLAGTNMWASRDMRALLQSVSGQTNGIGFHPVLSDNGKFVVYEASRTLLPSGAFTGILLRYGLETGLTELLHTNVTVLVPAEPEVPHLDVSPDGGLVVFVANSNGVSGTTTCIQVWDATSGTITLASGDLTNAVTSGSVSDCPVLDGSGRYVTFLSSAAGLVTNPVAGEWQIYTRDLETGTTILVSADAAGTGSSVTSVSIPAANADGRYVAFEGDDGTLVGNDNNRSLDVFLRDMAAGSNELISVAHPALLTRTPNGASTLTEFSASTDGRFVAFASDADNLALNDTNGVRDVFVADLAAGTNQAVSVDVAGAVGNGVASEAVISGDGRYVAFTSSATNLVAGDTNNYSDVFVRDLQTGVTLLVSRKANGSGPGNGASYTPVISTDGRWLLFRSQAKDLAPGSFTGTDNLFLRDLQSATNWALTTGGLTSAAMTPDGRYIVFVEGVLGYSTVRTFVWYSHLKSRVLINSASSVNNLAISADGGLIAYTESGQLRLQDRVVLGWWLVVPMPLGSRPVPKFSADGNWLTYTRFVSPWHQVYLYDILGNTERLVSHLPGSTTAAAGDSDSPQLSPDGRFVVYRTFATNLVAGVGNHMRQLVLYDRQSGFNTLLSASRYTGGPADNHSLRAELSADGQVLFLQSWASDLTANDFNSNGDVLATMMASAKLAAAILPTATLGIGPQLSWPALGSGNYRVQYKNGLSDPQWHDLPGTPTISGLRAWMQDPAPDPTQRLYRIISY